MLELYSYGVSKTFGADREGPRRFHATLKIEIRVSAARYATDGLSSLFLSPTRLDV